MESLFVLYQVTGNPLYQDWGWHIFRAFEKFCKVDSGGYTNLDSVLSVSSCWLLGCHAVLRHAVLLWCMLCCAVLGYAVRML